MVKTGGEEFDGAGGGGDEVSSEQPQSNHSEERNHFRATQGIINRKKTGANAAVT